MAQGGGAVTAFPVKCAGCGAIYDGASIKRCPTCDTESITPRSRWNRADYETAEKIAKEDGQ